MLMLTDKKLEELQWEDQCQNDLCSFPDTHSHNFKQGKEIKKNCSPPCAKEMKIEVQVYENFLGQNAVALRNIYKCECGAIDDFPLYNGQPS